VSSLTFVRRNGIQVFQELEDNRKSEAKVESRAPEGEE